MTDLQTHYVAMAFHPYFKRPKKFECWLVQRDEDIWPHGFGENPSIALGALMRKLHECKVNHVLKLGFVELKQPIGGNDA